MIEDEWASKIGRMLELKAAAKALKVEDKIQPILDKMHDDMHRESRAASVEPMSMYFMVTELCKRLDVHPADFMHFCKQIIRHLDNRTDLDAARAEFNEV